MTITYQLRGSITVTAPTQDQCDEQAAEEVQTINDCSSAQVEIAGQEEVQE